MTLGTTTPISEIGPGKIVTLKLETMKPFESVHVFLSLDKGRGIGLWYYPLDPKTGTSKVGAQIMLIEDLIDMVVDMYSLESSDKVLVNQLSIEQFIGVSED